MQLTSEQLDVLAELADFVNFGCHAQDVQSIAINPIQRQLSLALYVINNNTLSDIPSDSYTGQAIRALVNYADHELPTSWGPRSEGWSYCVGFMQTSG